MNALNDLRPADGLLAQLHLLRIEHTATVTHLRLNRPAKRNAINEELVRQLHTAVLNLPVSTKALVISGDGDHFCAGLDLSDLTDRSVAEGVLHSRGWHVVMDAIQFCAVPVVVALHG
ncbi:MAG: enoyl-CoA hydratase, partial [Rubrivivax sp.]